MASEQPNRSALPLAEAEEVLAALGEEWTALNLMSYHGESRWTADITEKDVERLRSLILSAASALAKLAAVSERYEKALTEIAAGYSWDSNGHTIAKEALDG